MRIALHATHASLFVPCYFISLPLLDMSQSNKLAAKKTQAAPPVTVTAPSPRSYGNDKSPPPPPLGEKPGKVSSSGPSMQQKPAKLSKQTLSVQTAISRGETESNTKIGSVPRSAGLESAGITSALAVSPSANQMHFRATSTQPTTESTKSNKLKRKVTILPVSTDHIYEIPAMKSPSLPANNGLHRSKSLVKLERTKAQHTIRQLEFNGQVAPGVLKRSDRLMDSNGHCQSVWEVFAKILTFWYVQAYLFKITCRAPAFFLRKCLKMEDPSVQQAWREKVGLCSVSLLMMSFLLWFTFFFQASTCPPPGIPQFTATKAHDPTVSAGWFTDKFHLTISRPSDDTRKNLRHIDMVCTKSSSSYKVRRGSSGCHGVSG